MRLIVERNMLDRLVVLKIRLGEQYRRMKKPKRFAIVCHSPTKLSVQPVEIICSTKRNESG